MEQGKRTKSIEKKNPARCPHVSKKKKEEIHIHELFSKNGNESTLLQDEVRQRKIVAIDPNAKDLMCTVKNLEPEKDFKKLRYSKSRRRKKQKTAQNAKDRGKLEIATIVQVPSWLLREDGDEALEDASVRLVNNCLGRYSSKSLLSATFRLYLKLKIPPTSLFLFFIKMRYFEN